MTLSDNILSGRSYDVRGGMLAGPYKVPVVNGTVGPDVDLSNLVIALSSLSGNNQEMVRSSSGKIPVKVGIMYDLRPDPEKFDPTRTNNNPGRYDLNGNARVLDDTLLIERDPGQIRELARFLKERRADEERLEHTVSEELQVFIYLRDI